LTILSIGTATALLVLLMVGLLLILKPLEAIRAQLERITMGVRAIERQTQETGGIAGRAGEALNDVGRALDGLASTLPTHVRTVHRAGRRARDLATTRE
jgi:hypothetical protein